MVCIRETKHPENLSATSLRTRPATYSRKFHGASFFTISRNKIPANISTYTVWYASLNLVCVRANLGCARETAVRRWVCPCQGRSLAERRGEWVWQRWVGQGEGQGWRMVAMKACSEVGKHKSFHDNLTDLELSRTMGTCNLQAKN